MLNFTSKKKNAWKSLYGFFFALMMPFIMAIQFVVEDGAGGSASKEDVELLEKINTTVSAKMADQLKKLNDDFKKTANDARLGLITKEDFDSKIIDLTNKLKSIDVEKYNAYETKLTEMKETIRIQGEELNKQKDKLPEGQTNSLKAELQKIVESAEFKTYLDSKQNGKAKFELKTVSITSDYTGTSRVHITTRDGRVVDHPQVSRLNIRDLLVVAPTDLPYLAFIEVYDWVRTAGPVSENGALPESSFKVRESTVDAKRIGTHVPVSKRMLRSASYVVNHLAVRLPAQVRYNEDFQFLYGDGAGNNVTGIAKVASDFATMVATALTGIAGSVASIATYDGGTKTLVNFVANQLINNGDKITFAGTTAGTYDHEYTAIVVGPRQIMIEQAYTADAGFANWTFTSTNAFYHGVEAAQEIDVLKVGRTLVTQQEYTCNGYVLNPVDATKIEVLKGSDEHYLEVNRDAMGILRISGIPVVETTAMPAGKFALGDWMLAAALFEFTSLVLEFSESTTEKLANSVEAIIQEEILFPIYNKYMFVVGDFGTAITAIDKP